MVHVHLYSSVHNFVIVPFVGTDKNGENWYMTNNKQFTVSDTIINTLYIFAMYFHLVKQHRNAPVNRLQADNPNTILVGMTNRNGKINRKGCYLGHFKANFKKYFNMI